MADWERHPQVVPAKGVTDVALAGTGRLDGGLDGGPDEAAGSRRAAIPSAGAGAVCGDVAAVTVVDRANWHVFFRSR